MNVFVVGLNHKTAPVEIREKLAFNDRDLETILPQFQRHTGMEEGLIVSTCNRVEVYGVGTSSKTQESLKDFLSEYHELPRKKLDPYLYDQIQPSSVGHLFRVGCGLDSMVLGETEIFGQLKKAYSKASDLKSVGTVLHRLFQKAFKIGKKIRTETAINTGAVSVSSVAVELAEKIFGQLKDKKVMIMGAGEVAETAIHHLVDRGTLSILASNRSYERAEKLARRFNGEAVHYDEAFTRMKEVDIVISSTSAPHPIIHEDEARKLMHDRGQRPMFFIDIAVPRDIQPEVNKIDNVYLYNIDDLNESADSNLRSRQEQIAHCDSLIQEEVARFMSWLEKNKNGRKKL